MSEVERGMTAEIRALRRALRQVAQAHAWLAFGECRSFGADVLLLSPHDADAVARVALGEYRDGSDAETSRPTTATKETR